MSAGLVRLRTALGRGHRIGIVRQERRRVSLPNGIERVPRRRGRSSSLPELERGYWAGIMPVPAKRVHTEVKLTLALVPVERVVVVSPADGLLVEDIIRVGARAEEHVLLRYDGAERTAVRGRDMRPTQHAAGIGRRSARRGERSGARRSPMAHQRYNTSHTECRAFG